MFPKYFAIGAALLAVASAAPLAKRDACQEGTYNCIGGTQYAQCMSGGVWSEQMPVAPGTTCQSGVSSNPFTPGSSTESSPSSQPSEPASDPSPSTGSPPKDGSPPPATSSTTSSPPPSTGSSGSDCGGFTCMADWPSWDQMVAKFGPTLGQSCESQGWGANNSPDETQQVLAAIKSGSGSVDPRFVLSIAIQESQGCVRVITTNNGVRNPGILQDSQGSHSCNDGGVVQNPCPVDEINGMIADGVSGGDDNLSKALATATGAPNNFKDAFAYAVLSRIYNSGSFDAGDLNNGLGSTSSYVSSVMGRLAPI